MANLYGSLLDTYKANATPATRTAGREIRARLETWDGAIQVELDKDGNFAVYIGEKTNPNELILEGNVNDGEDFAVTPAGNYVVDHRD